MSDTIITLFLPRDIEKHNNLVKRIEATGEFTIPKPNASTGYIIGHIEVKNPEPDHPKTSFENLPVGYANYDEFHLVNINQPALRKYHDRLKSIISEVPK